jgi:hypothetical protein
MHRTHRDGETDSARIIWLPFKPPAILTTKLGCRHRLGVVLPNQRKRFRRRFRGLCLCREDTMNGMSKISCGCEFAAVDPEVFATANGAEATTPHLQIGRCTEHVGISGALGPVAVPVDAIREVEAKGPAD